VGALFSNLFLVYLIIYRSSPELGAYRYLLLAFAVNDVYYPIVHMLTSPVVFAYKDAFIMFSYGIFTSRASISVFAAVYSQTMPLLAHLYVYRLIALKCGHSLHRLHHLVFEVVLKTFLFKGKYFRFLNCIINYEPDQETRDYVQPILDEYFNGDGQEFIGALFYSVKGEVRMRAFLATSGFNAIMTISVSVIVFCSSSIVLFFRSAKAAILIKIISSDGSAYDFRVLTMRGHHKSGHVWLSNVRVSESDSICVFSLSSD
ncbi:hypothetical protein PENTCL1PPCAC_20329, partial [Pristionchus entomophagus]